ncbi:glycoside hydrolase family 127 protein [Muricauda sp. SCSIO 64092]|uniref:beta-L-arabinofuranosidase domain-containing protein n=1 Tax=Allomuricauda sp. SCSIO 64092 TaxID=2908842 RepID=UPI001FF6E1FC|nr:beta-L-arabinofuranosidase domain-containing protein [Muricauda sp. SCSIO 64092]UOY05295.1 glycoside hydrolase family 127 protein [Muricauda sp. SCSIO 64092]
MKRVPFFLLLFLALQACGQKQQLGLSNGYRAKIEASLHLGVQHASEACLDEDGKARGDYEMITGKWSEYEPAWHTGQLIQGLLAAYEVTQNKKALEQAKKAGDWWVSLQFPKGHVLEGYLKAIHGASVGNLINTTTITDGTPGLFDLTDSTGDTKYAEVATAAGKWILDNLYLPEHRLSYNIVDPLTGEIWKDRSPHAQHQGHEITIQQVARPNAEGYLWKDMYLFNGEQRYKKAFLALCDGLIERQSANGFWMDFEPNDSNTGKIHARFNTWNAEALVEAYTLTKDKKYLSAAMKTAEGLASIQQENGVIFYVSYADGTVDDRSPCGSGTAFAGILWLRLMELGKPDFLENIKKALDFTLKNQFSKDHADKNLAGGYFEIRQKTKGNGQMKLIYRDIATAFGLRFLSKVYQYEFL